MSKKVIKLTESDLERIVRRVIEEQYAGVAFGAEQNGLRIKKVEATEQVTTKPVAKQSGAKLGEPVITAQMMGITPAVKKVLDILGAKASQGEKNPTTVVNEDPKSLYLGDTETDSEGNKFITSVYKYAPIMGTVNYPFPKWVITTSYTKGGSQAYTGPDGVVVQNAYSKWNSEPIQHDSTAPTKQEDIRNFFEAFKSYKVNPEEFKKAIIATYSDPKVKPLLLKAKQIAQTTQTVPSMYKQVLSSLG